MVAVVCILVFLYSKLSLLHNSWARKTWFSKVLSRKRKGSWLITKHAMDRRGALKSHTEKLGVIFQLSFFYSLCLKASEASQKTRKFAKQYSLHYLSLISPCWQLCYPFVFCPIQEKMSTSHPVLHAGSKTCEEKLCCFVRFHECTKRLGDEKDKK